MMTYPIVALIYYQFFYTFLEKKDFRFDTFFKSLFYLQVFLIVFIIFEAFYSKKLDTFMDYIHSNDLKYWRIRLLTYEESWVGSIITIISFLNMYLVTYLDKRKIVMLVTYLSSIFFIIFYSIRSESKGYLLVFLISALPLLIQYLYNNKKTRKFLIIGIVCIFSLGITLFFSLKEFVFQQLYSSITFGTRFSSYLSAISTFAYHPLGVGWGPYLCFYPNNLIDVINSDIMSPFNLEEVKLYLNDTKSLSSKTYFFDNLVFGGIPFLLFYFIFFIKRYIYFSKLKIQQLAFIRIPLLYVILSSLLYVTFSIKYEVWFFMAFLDVLQKKIKSKVLV
ncbi:hypothetical protein NBT05_05260 [Aquimarina sp. ERC-38]|uniref:hypothetical protein n=1 Tax=Aquimarina sp. ERC-38 TaxID=2949996 RepID=UPI002245CF94|nr:hypothetical protein [Aquimarina sp. ERC-38]UZO81874.1 hypothetical protein NBT05_05260 [Aquimarina sp. ERC-38]